MEVVPDQVRKISRRHQGDPARAVGDINRIGQTLRRQLANCFEFGGKQPLTGAPRRQQLHANHKLAIDELA